MTQLIYSEIRNAIMYVSGAIFQRTMSVNPWAPTSVLPLYTIILNLMPVGVSLGLETGKTASYLQGPWARGSHDQYRTFDVCTLNYSAILDFPLGNYLSLGVYVYFRLGNTQQWVMITLKVKCIAMDSNETMFVTGSADGDIKVSTILKTYVNTHMSLNAGVGSDLSESDPVLPSGAFKTWALQKHKPRSGSGLIWFKPLILNSYVNPRLAWMMVPSTLVELMEAWRWGGCQKGMSMSMSETFESNHER